MKHSKIVKSFDGKGKVPSADWFREHLQDVGGLFDQSRTLGHLRQYPGGTSKKGTRAGAKRKSNA